MYMYIYMFLHVLFYKRGGINMNKLPAKKAKKAFIPVFIFEKINFVIDLGSRFFLSTYRD